MKPKISVIVTNWNTVNLLKKYFPYVIKNSPEAFEIIFADDASQDNSLQYVKSLQLHEKRIKIISNTTNLGFGDNSNNAVKAAKGEYIALLNSDILPHPHYLKNALAQFKNKSIFGVGFCEVGNENWSKLFWKQGYLQYTSGKSIRKTHITGWLSGGGSLIKREYFLKLGGFDHVYHPFYSEDVDLGYRAWKSGYTLLWEPTAKIEHHHESTMSKFPRRLLDYVKERNRLLTVLRNIEDPSLLRQNRLTQLFRILTGPNYIKIILAAYRQLKSHPSPIFTHQRTDKEIFALFSKFI